jgi:hypothetical protein
MKREPVGTLKLKRIQMISTIVATIAVPVLIAFFGWLIQSRIADQSVQRDYVQMALSVLSKPATEKDQALRAWAVKVLSKSSPVPFSAKVEHRLESAPIYFVPRIPASIMKSDLMSPPQQWKPLKEGEGKLGDLLLNVAENRNRCDMNAINLKYLQQVVRAMSGDKTPETPDLPNGKQGPEPPNPTPWGDGLLPN